MTVTKIWMIAVVSAGLLAVGCLGAEEENPVQSQGQALTFSLNGQGEWIPQTSADAIALPKPCESPGRDCTVQGDCGRYCDCKQATCQNMAFVPRDETPVEH